MVNFVIITFQTGVDAKFLKALNKEVFEYLSKVLSKVNLFLKSIDI